MPPSEYHTQSVAGTRRELLKALARAPGLLLIEGPSGCGKSHLKKQIGAALAHRFTLVDLPYSRLEPRQFATTLASCLSPGDPPAADPLTRVQKQIDTCARSGKPLLLLIDDAQFMPADTRAALAALAAQARESESPIYGVLFADAGANERFALLPGADRDQGLHQRLTLGPPSVADMTGFLNAQPGQETLSDESKEQLLTQASGSLRRLRQLLDLALLEQASQSQAENSTDEPGTDSQAPRRQGGQFAFGLVGGDDFPEPGPATRRALEKGNELEALSATDTAPQAAPQVPSPADGAKLPVLYTDETASDDFPQRPALRPGWLATTLGAALILVLLGTPLLQEQAPLASFFAQESAQNDSGQPQAASIAVEPPPPAPPQTPLPAAPAPAPSGAGAVVEESTPESAAATLPPPEPRTSATPSPAVTTPEQPSLAVTTPEPPPPVVNRAEAGEQKAAQPGRKDQAVNRWLEQARAHEAAYRLTLPTDDNAVRSYREILTVNPEHALARAGLKRIQDLYRNRAARALEQQDWEEARHNLKRLLWIDSNDREAIDQLARLVRRLEQPQADAGQ